MKTSDVARFLSKFDAVNNSCWLWRASLNPRGYGQFYSDGRMLKAHRFSYELFRGPIPEGLEVDHLCHDPAACTLPECPHRRCMNPWHMALVEHAENANPHRRKIRECGKTNRAKTHCPQGHEYTPENIYLNRKLARECHICRRTRRRLVHG